MGEMGDGGKVKANNYKHLWELFVLLCLFLAVGADWSSWESKMTAHKAVFEKFEVSGTGYISAHVAERAVKQAIESAKRREARNETPRDTVTISVNGERLKVVNLEFDGFASWCLGKTPGADPDQFELVPVEEVADRGDRIRAKMEDLIRQIHTAALEVGFKRLAMVDSDFNPRLSAYSLTVRPVNTTSFRQAFDVSAGLDICQKYPDNDSTLAIVFQLQSALDFLNGLLVRNRPLMTEAVA